MVDVRLGSAVKAIAEISVEVIHTETGKAVATWIKQKNQHKTNAYFCRSKIT